MDIFIRTSLILVLVEIEMQKNMHFLSGYLLMGNVIMWTSLAIAMAGHCRELELFYEITVCLIA